MSRIKLGDRVRFVNENMSGVVTRVDGNTAGVTIEDDFEIPVLLSEIVKIHEDAEQPKEERSITQKPHFVKVHSGIHIAFDRITETLLDLKLHNSETDLVLFAFYEKHKDQFVLKKTGEVELEQHVSLGRYQLEEFGNWGTFAFQVTFINRNSDRFKDQLVKTIRFTAKEFHGAFRSCYFLGKQAYTFRLDEAFSELDLQKLAQKDFSESTSSPLSLPDFSKKPADIVDLHIEKLVKDHTRLQAQEIINLQMDAFLQTLEAAHVHNMKKIIFIHGVGNHFLKNKIRNALSRQKAVVREYHDADMLKFGGGATEVLLK